MKRVRWFRASWPTSLKELVSSFRLHSFTQDKESGFLLGRVRENFIEARYIEKREIQETVVDPFGSESIYQRLIFNQIDFSLLGLFSTIEIFDSPRSIQGFICRLLEICDFNLVIDPKPVNLLKWVDELEKKVSSQVVVESIQIAGLELEEGAIGKVLLNGVKDVRPVLGRFAGNKKFVMENLRLRVPLLGKSVLLSLSANCSARLPEENIEDLLPLLRESLFDIS